MKVALTLFSVASVLSLASCANQKVEEDPYAASPAADLNNPYGVPQTPTTPAPQVYSPPQANIPAPPSASYQPIPAPPTAPPAYGNFPEPPTAPAPTYSGNTTLHTVVAGDTLWGLSQRYSTTVSAIKAANGLSSDTIRKGETLNIPQ